MPNSTSKDKTSFQLAIDVFGIIRSDKKEIWLIVFYSIISVILSLIMPIVAQAIVNAVALGVFTTQLLTLCLLVGVGTLFAGGFQVLERYIIDVLERRIFVKLSLEFAQRIPAIQASEFEQHYAPELINRFFDIVTVHKNIGKFLIDGINSLLVIFAGLILLGIYHPFFILFDFGLLLFIPFLVYILGWNGAKSAILTSKEKYKQAQWLEEIARCQTTFKLLPDSPYLFKRFDEISVNYIQKRAKHFIVIARQLLGTAVFKGLAIAGVLGLGGLLVMEGQLTLGQLVAAEIMIIYMLSSIDKLLGMFDGYYDMIAAMGKINEVRDKKLEESIDDENAIMCQGEGMNITLKDVSYQNTMETTCNIQHLDLEIHSGDKISFVGASLSGLSAIPKIMMGFNQHETGRIEINNIDIRRISLKELRRHIGIVLPMNELFDGTIEDNITLGVYYTNEEINWALKTVHLYDDVMNFKLGLATPVTSEGLNLPKGMIRKIMFARSIISKPKILILDQAFEGVAQKDKISIINSLYSNRDWTILDITMDSDIILRSKRVITLEKGLIVEEGTPEELATKNSLFAELFPGLVLYYSKGV